jgi:hypothetical protein
MTCAKLFSNANQAAQYSLSRPNYPESLYEVILNACAGNRALAVDIGTGSGQAAVALAGKLCATNMVWRIYLNCKYTQKFTNCVPSIAPCRRFRLDYDNYHVVMHVAA